MVHGVKVLAAKPGDLSLIFGRQMMERRKLTLTSFCSLSFMLILTIWEIIPAPTSTPTLIY